MIYHPFSWRGWLDFGSGALGDIAPHAMNIVFMALDLGAPSSVEIVATSGLKREMFPDWSTLRFDYAARGSHPPLSIYWYDGNQSLPPAVAGQPDEHGMVWIGTKGSYPAGRGPFAGGKQETPPPPPERAWGREEVHKDWVEAVKAGKPAPCNFLYAGPFTEAYQLGNVALRVGHRIEWDPVEFRVTNCREANRYVEREFRRGCELRSIAGSAYTIRGAG